MVVFFMQEAPSTVFDPRAVVSVYDFIPAAGHPRWRDQLERYWHGRPPREIAVGSTVVLVRYAIDPEGQALDAVVAVGQPQGSMAFLPLNPTTTDPGTQSTVRWDRHAFRNLGIVSATILLTPFALWTVWNFVKGWGKWRIGKSGDRPHYVRTWHGWVEAEQAATRAVEREEFRNHVRQKLAWRTTTADYSWIFWDPSGTKRQEYEGNRRHSLIRHVPRWMRSYAPGSLMPDARITPNRLGAAEEGKVSLRSFRHGSEIQPLEFSFTENQSWLRSSSKQGADTLAEIHTPSDSVPMMTGALADSHNAHRLSTVRRRKFAMGPYQVWDADGQETSGATCPQSWAPTQIGDLGADVDPASESGAWAFRIQPSPTSENVAAGLARRACSLPLFTTLRNAYHARRRSKPPSETLPVRSGQRPKLDPATGGHDYSAPENPDALQGSGHRLRNPDSTLPAVMPPYVRELMQTFNQSFEPLAKPVVLNPFLRIGTEYSGIAGRPGSPIMDWTIQEKPRAAASELSQYEAEGPVKGASSFSCSSCSSASFRSCSDGEYANMHLNKAGLQQTKGSTVTSKLDADGRAGTHSARGARASDSFFQGSYSPGAIALHFSILPRNTSRKSLVSVSTPGVPPRFRNFTPEASFAERKSRTEKLSMLSRVDTSYPPRPSNPKSTAVAPFDVPRSKEQTQSPTKSSTRSTTNAKTIQAASTSATTFRLSKATTERAECLSPLEKTFLDDLDLRLNRLDYELSPGFRGPSGDGGRPAWWFDPIPYSASVASRNSQAFVTHGAAIRKPLNPPPILRRSYTAMGVSKSNDTNDSTTVLQRRASSEDVLIVRSKHAYNGEPEEGEIDTAAWMLRRPPMGSLREDPAEKTLLFTNGRGPAKTISEWQQLEPLLPLQQALDSAAAISRLPAKHLKKLGILGNDRNDGCKDEKQPLRTAVDPCDDGGDHADESAHTTPPVIEVSPIQRIFNRASVAVDDRIIRDSPMGGYRSPNHTMMQ
ncbi:hypothetical protein MMC07_002854 [Pseudocyphellaria aurata]|nr:hypothetical protein [Pseudocyphellaria aurata]